MEYMNKAEQKIYFLLEKQGLDIFNIGDLVNLGFRKKNAYSLLSALAKKKIISRIRRGVYVRASPELLYDALQQMESPILMAAKAAGSGYYLAYTSAMQVYGVAEQVPFVVYVVSKKQKRNFVYEKYKVKFIKPSKRKFFGIKKAVVSSSAIYVSDEEKTIVDCVDQIDYCGGANYVFSMIRKLIKKNKLDWKKLLGYAEKIGEQALFHRLGFLLEKVDLSGNGELVPNKVIDALSKKIKPNVYYLEKGVKGKFNKRWQLIENVVEEYGV